MRIILDSEAEVTKPFIFDHAVVSGRKEVQSRDYYGRRLDKVYDVIDVYVSKDRKPYYIWTKLGNGNNLVKKLEAKFKGKWVVAEVRLAGNLRDRISGVHIEVVNPPSQNYSKPNNPISTATPKKPEQLELDLFESSKKTITLDQLKRLIFG